MRISAKGRYAIAAMIEMARAAQAGENMTVIRISKRLGISKIYLEQVFSQLRKSGLVHSVKGAQGGYQLARMPGQIPVWDILQTVEFSLFAPAEPTVAQAAPEIEKAMQVSAFEKLDQAVASALQGITLQDLVEEAARQSGGEGYMFYI